MKNKIIGGREVRHKGEKCPCGHDKDSHSTVDSICYGGDNCKCGMSYPLRVRMPVINSIQEVNLNIKKPQLRPERCQAKILEILDIQKVSHRNFGTDAFVLCNVEVNGEKHVGFVEWANETEVSK